MQRPESLHLFIMNDDDHAIHDLSHSDCYSVRLAVVGPCSRRNGCRGVPTAGVDVSAVLQASKQMDAPSVRQAFTFRKTTAGFGSGLMKDMRIER